MNKTFTEGIRAVVFDADDTLWSNEPLFRRAEDECAALLAEYGDSEYIKAELFKTEMSNMQELGYGAKAFIISMLETAVRVSGGEVSAVKMKAIIDAGRRILRNPAVPLAGVVETLSKIRQSGRYRMTVMTKGELLDQNQKMDRSGLRGYFDFVEVVREKDDSAYNEICKRLNVNPEEMLMVGNSFKSDIDPVLKRGGWGVYIPAEMTWQHELAEEYDHPCLFRAEKFSDLVGILL